MKENEIQKDLNLLQIYKEANSILSIDKKYIIEDNSQILFPLMKAFLNKEYIPLNIKKKYISPFLVHDIQLDSFYPLFIFKIKKNDNSMISYEDELPIINKAAQSILLKYGIKIKEDFSFDDISFCYQVLKDKIDVLMLKDKIELIPYFSYFDDNDISYSLIYDWLEKYIKDSTLDEKYTALLNNVEDEEKEKEVFDKSYGLFDRVQRVFLRNELYHGAKVSINDDHMLDFFFVKYFYKNKDERKHTMILCSSEDEKKIKDIIKNHKLDDFVLNIKDYSKDEIVSLLENNKDSKINEKRNLNILSRKKEQLNSFIEKKEECFSLMKPYLNNEYVSHISKIDGNLIDIDFSSYSKEDLLKDKEFFNVFDDLSTFKEKDISSHPYFGLTSPIERENYSYLQLVLIDLINSIKKFTELISNSEDVKRYNLTINNLKDFQFIYQSGKLLSKYNGFPRKYFNVNVDDENKYDLNILKKIFQSLSSAKLVILNLCDEGIFKEDLSEIVMNFNSIHLLKRSKANRIIKKYFKLNKNTDYSPLIRVFKSYINSKKSLDEVLPKYIDVYGDSVSTMNGLVEIQENIAYVNTVREYEKKYPNFQFDHPFVKHCLKDKGYRIETLKKLEEANGVYQQIDFKLQQYTYFYKELSLSSLWETSFDDLFNKFKKETLYSYLEFEEYCKFREAKNSSSRFLIAIINRYIKNHQCLDSLKDDFYYSLVYSTYIKCVEEYKPYNENCLSLKKYILSASKDEKDIDDSLLYFSYERKRNEDKDRYLQFVNKEYNNENKKELLACLLDEYPIVFATKDDLGYLTDEVFDDVIVVNSENLDNVSLLSSIRVGKNSLYINTNNVVDHRVIGYHETYISISNIINGYFSLKDIDKNVLSKLKEDCIKHNAKLITDNDKYPLIVEYKNVKYGILFDICYDKNDVLPQFITEFGDYLSIYENIELLVIDIYGYIFNEEDIFDYIENK